MNTEGISFRELETGAALELSSSETLPRKSTHGRPRAQVRYKWEMYRTPYNRYLGVFSIQAVPSGQSSPNQYLGVAFAALPGCPAAGVGSFQQIQQKHKK